MKVCAGKRVAICPALLVAGILGALASTAPAVEEAPEVVRDLVYAEPEGTALLADVYRPAGEGPFPGVLCVHGGAWMSGNQRQLGFVAKRLAREGYVTVAVSYRLAPKHPFPAQIEDCRAALAWMIGQADRYRIDPKRIAAWGYSAGGQLVALLGAEPVAGTADGASGPRVRAVVAGGAPCDFQYLPPKAKGLSFWLGGTRSEVPEAYRAASPLRFVSADDPPMFFYHGTKDHLVRIALPRAMVGRLKEAGVEARLHEVEGAGHLLALFNRTAIDEGVKFLDKHVKRSK